MQKYRVLVHGRSLLTRIEGRARKVGFFTNVYVEAFSADDAAGVALELIRQDAHVREISLNREEDPLVLSVDETREMETFEGVKLPRTGLTLYEEDIDGAKPS